MRAAWPGEVICGRCVEQYTAAKAAPAIVKAFQALRLNTPPPDYQDVFLKGLVAAGLDLAAVNKLVNP